MESPKKSSQISWLLCAVFIVFLILKLAEIGQVKDWNWWWVTSPLWGGLAIGLSLLILGFILITIMDGFKKLRKKKNEPKLGSIIKKKSRFQDRLDEIDKAREELRKKRNKDQQ